jgi:hypothetical protein
MDSSVLRRGLAGILQSGLWDELGRRDRLPTTALITDIGNDIAYGADTETILEWIEECIERLGASDGEVLVTGLPLSSLATLGRVRYEVFRALLVPSCKLTLSQVLTRAAELQPRLEALAEKRRIAFFGLRDEWYGIDPIHMRPRVWSAAWSEIVARAAGIADPPAVGRPGRVEWARCFLARPQRESFFGLERRRDQPALRLASGTSVSLY